MTPSQGVNVSLRWSCGSLLSITLVSDHEIGFKTLRPAILSVSPTAANPTLFTFLRSLADDILILDVQIEMNIPDQCFLLDTALLLLFYVSFTIYVKH